MFESNCWAFSATGAMEGSLLVSNQTNVTLSPQQLTSCSNVVNNGCNGGVPMYGHWYSNQSGIAQASSYPLTSSSGTAVNNLRNFQISNVLSNFSF